MTRRVLVAGIGNMFLGDDGFGCEVVRRLAASPLPAGVHLRDFGIRSMDLAFALMDGYEAAILIDAVQRGGTPGTLYVLEPELQALSAEPVAGPHDLSVAGVLGLVAALGGTPPRLLLVGCEAAEWEEAIALSGPVNQAVASAAEMVLALIADLACGGRVSYA